MADTTPSAGQTPTTAYDRGAAQATSGWTGWVVFAGVMAVTLGIFQIIQGVVALLDDGFYLVAPSGLIVDVDYNSWGWVHLGLGVLAVLIGMGLFTGNIVARVAGVIVAVLSALVNLSFIAAYPIWSTMIIAFDVIIIYAITVHGGEQRVQA
jgi:hypothetical protein